MLDTVALTIKDRSTNDPAPKVSTASHILQDWDYGVFEDPQTVCRAELLSKVTEAAREALYAARDELVKMCPRDRDDEDVDKSGPAWHIRLFQKFCKGGADDVSETLLQLSFNKFFISFDECCTLGVPDRISGADVKKESMSLIAMRRIIKTAEPYVRDDGQTFHIWAFFLDTNSAIFHLAETGKSGSSSRLTNQHTIATFHLPASKPDATQA